MSASRPEADIEYSRGLRASDTSSGASRTLVTGAPTGVVLGVLAGAVLLLVAEFAPLLRVHSGAYHAGVVATIGTGSHHSYALIPVALLAVALASAARATGNRLALVSVALLGLVALGIALLGDLPDAHAAGLIRRPGGNYVNASSSAAAGLYLETLGAVVLLLAGGAGLLLGAPGNQGGRARFQRLPSLRRRSAS
jgi:hypothetical protein